MLHASKVHLTGRAAVRQDGYRRFAHARVMIHALVAAGLINRSTVRDLSSNFKTAGDCRKPFHGLTSNIERIEKRLELDPRMSEADQSMNTRQRSAVFIDGANLYATTKALGFDIDYKRLLREFQGRDNLLRAFYYTAMVEDQEYSSIRPLIDWLDYNGYRVVTKPVKEFTDSAGRRKVKGNMDIELTIDALELAPHIDQMYLFSGDGDFRSLVEAMQRRGVRVSVISTIQTQPGMIADDLRRQADEFIDLATLGARVGRDPSERTSRPVEPGPRSRSGNLGLESRYGIRQAGEDSEDRD